MKKLFTVIAIATALSFVWSCEKEQAPEKDPQENPGNTDTPGEQEGATIAEITAVLENSTVKTAWAEGDAILVYAVVDGSDVAAKYVLSSGANTASGKFTPSAQALPAGATGYFATYPYNEDLTFAQHNTFAFAMEAEQAEVVPVFAYADDAANLTFKSPVGAIKLPLAGKGGIAKLELTDNESKNVLNGNVTYNPKTTKFDIKNSAASKNVIAKVLAEKIELGDTPADFTIELPAGALATGGVVVLYDVNNSPLASIEVPAQTIEAGKVAALETQNVVPVAQTVNLNSIQGYANTYQIPAVGKYKFAAVKGNDKTLKLDAATAEITWETWCNNEPVTANSLVKSVAVEEGFVVIETADEYRAGDALVSVKDASGTIIWSWLLWFTEATIAEVDLGGVVVMDRNLGALTTEKDKPGLNYGLLWQWGRHAPIVGLDGTRGEDPVAMKVAPETAAPERVEAAEGEDGFSMDYAIAHPTQFLKGAARDWSNADAHDEFAGLFWNTAKTIYDPCPAGYQVLTYSEAFELALVGGLYDSTNLGFTVGECWFPITGRWKYSGGTYRSETEECYFWTTNQIYRDEELGYCVASFFGIEGDTIDASYESMGSAQTIRCELSPAN